MRILLISLIVATCLLSCRHRPGDPVLLIDPIIPVDSTLTDFRFIPVNHAKWVVHFRGNYYYDSTGGHLDSTYYSTTTVLSTGTNTVHNGKTYYIYTTTTTSTNLSPGVDTGFLYIREDTAAQKLYCWSQIMNVTYPTEVPLIDYSLHVGDAAMITNAYSGTIVRTDSVAVAGQYCKRWIETNTRTANNFYQAYGIGWRMGILPWARYNADGGQVISLDYIYKTDSIHLDFPFYR